MSHKHHADDTLSDSSDDDDLIPVQIDPDHDFVYEVPDDPSKCFIIERKGEYVIDMDRYEYLRDTGALKVITDKKELEEIYKKTRAPIPRKTALAQLEAAFKKLCEEGATGKANSGNFEERLKQLEADVAALRKAARVPRESGDKDGDAGQKTTKKERKVDE
uniref:TFIIIC_sub6 domain-containing protein n=1 Tax=Panagrellus redivivus TaxID=6233 RepID=A0A7E4W189_PANRE